MEEEGVERPHPPRDTTRAMSAENVELVKATFQAFNRRDFDAARLLAHDSITWKSLFAVETDVLRGIEEILAGWKRQIEALDVRIDVLELKPLDATRVLAVGRWRGRGAESGAPVEQTAAQVFTIEGGQIRTVETYRTRDEALKAAGLQK
jgi:ketosteroid isomerase-like protein